MDRTYHVDKWWGYITKVGTIKVKIYNGDEEVNKALENLFIDKVIPPFEALNSEDAYLKILGRDKGIIK